jgi:hypothetical protein
VAFGEWTTTQVQQSADGNTCVIISDGLTFVQMILPESASRTEMTPSQPPSTMNPLHEANPGRAPSLAAPLTVLVESAFGIATIEIAPEVVFTSKELLSGAKTRADGFFSFTERVSPVFAIPSNVQMRTALAVEVARYRPFLENATE